MKNAVTVSNEKMTSYLQQLHTPEGEKSLHRFLGLADNQFADLSQLDFMADFMGASLSGADLRGGRFSGLQFNSVDLSGADLRGADFSRAFFYETKLNGADLAGAYLDGASAYNVAFQGANLVGANAIEGIKAEAQDSKAIITLEDLVLAIVNGEISADQGYRYTKSLLQMVSTTEYPEIKTIYTTVAIDCITELQNLPSDKQPEALKEDLSAYRKNVLVPRAAIGLFSKWQPGEISLPNDLANLLAQFVDPKDLPSAASVSRSGLEGKSFIDQINTERSQPQDKGLSNIR